VYSLAQSNDCNAELFEKKPCAYLPRCETKSYVGSFTPFEVEQQLSGISTQWVDRGLESGNYIPIGHSDILTTPDVICSPKVTGWS
jgi:hypothetical protein